MYQHIRCRFSKGEECWLSIPFPAPALPRGEPISTGSLNSRIQKKKRIRTYTFLTYSSHILEHKKSINETILKQRIIN